MSYTNKIITPTGFPDFLVSDEEKNTEAFGLSVAKAIQHEWFYRTNTGSCEYYNRIEKYHNLRLYARGEQSSKLYKDLLDANDETYTNYDFRPLQIVPKFIKLIVNQMLERMFSIRAEAVDKYSTDLKDTYKKNLEYIMMSKPIMEEAKNAFGIDVFPDNFEEYPETQEEIDLHMNLKYKPAIEIAAEEALKFTLSLNDYDETQSRVIEDIVTLGIGAVKHTTDPSKGIVIEYVDPSNLVYSYPRNRDFKDVHYYGEVKRITINELKRLSNGKFTDEELKDIAKQSTSWNNYHNSNDFADNLNNSSNLSGLMMVDILNFNFKTTNTISYKKKYIKNGGYKMIKKESTFNKKSESDEGYDVSKKVIEVWYEGILILGTDKMVKYNLCENMVRPEGFLNITMPNYLLYSPEIYQNKTKSLVERIIPYVDQMQQIHIKLQQIIAKSRPNGVYIDIAGLNEIDLGNDNIATPLELIKIYNDLGIIVGSSKTEEGDFNYGKEPIRELRNGISEGLERLINSYNHYLNLLRDAIGVPQGADASMPHPDTLVGVQQQVVSNSNTATRHILDSILKITRNLGKGVSLRLKDIFIYSDLKDVYINAIGKINVEVLKAIEKYHLHDLGIIIELKPDAEEKQYLEQNISLALQQGLISINDAIDIRNTSNIKLANELLKIKNDKREKEKRNHEKELAKIQSDAQIQAAQQAAESRQMEFQSKTQLEITIIEAKSKADLIKLEAEKKAKAELMELEFGYNMTIKGVEVETSIMNEKHKENDKIRRQDRNNTQASQMIEQRKSNTPAINFESSNDNLNGNMGLGNFEPH